MKRIIFLAVLSAMLSGCEKKAAEFGRDEYRRSFSMYFYETDGVELIRYPHDTSPLHFNFEVNREGPYIGSYRESHGTREMYDILCEKYGDMTFDRKEFTVDYPAFQAYSFVSIEIASDADFDAKHPAGSSLNDLVTYHSNSSKPYIDSGYVECDWGEDPSFMYYNGSSIRPYYPVYKKASELSVDDMKLIYGAAGYSGYVYANGGLYFEKAPELSKTHLITVTFTDELGETFSDSIEMTFE